MTNEQFDKIIEILEQQKRMTAYIGLYVTYSFYTLAALLVVIVLAMLFSP